MKQNVTLKDIARELGISAKAVSTGINGTGRLSPETRKKIRTKALEMGYRPNIAAKALVHGKTRTLGIVAGDLTDVYFAGVADAALQESAKLGYQLLLGLTRWNQDEERRCLETLMDRNPDGIIYTPSFDCRNPHFKEVSVHKYPILLFHSENEIFSSLHADGEEALQKAGALLKERGADSAALCYFARHAVWKGALEGAGREIDIECQPVVKDLKELAKWLGRRRHKALIVKENRICLPLIEALKSVAPGYRPEIVQGYGDFHPYIPHPQIVGGVYVGTREMMTQAVRILVEWVDKGWPAERTRLYFRSLFFPAAEIAPPPEDLHLLNFSSDTY